jgi:Flp pilus assembly protein TadB
VPPCTSALRTKQTRSRHPPCAEAEPCPARKLLIIVVVVVVVVFGIVNVVVVVVVMIVIVVAVVVVTCSLANASLTLVTCAKRQKYTHTFHAIQQCCC